MKHLAWYDRTEVYLQAVRNWQLAKMCKECASINMAEFQSKIMPLQLYVDVLQELSTTDEHYAIYGCFSLTNQISWFWGIHRINLSITDYSFYIDAFGQLAIYLAAGVVAMLTFCDSAREGSRFVLL